jgi:hypothetical protein
MITTIIDADSLVYQAGFVVEHTFYDISTKGGKLIHTFEGKAKVNEWLKEHGKKESDFSIESRKEVQPVEVAFSILDNQLKGIQQTFQAEQALIYLTDDRSGYNFRDYVAMQRKYKDRPANTRPLYYDALRKHLVEKHHAYVITGFEADDAVAMQAWSTIYHEDVETVLVSIDKDLRMVPGRHYNPTKKTLDHVTPKQALHNFYVQLLTGDTTDTVPGLPRIGPKKAEDVYKDCDDEGDYFTTAYQLYKKAFGEAGLMVMIEQARLLWMLRWPGDVWLPKDMYLKEFLS